MATKISNEESLNRYETRLAQLGITDNEQFIEAARVAGNHLSAYLGESAAELADSIMVESSIPAAVMSEFESYPYALGVDIESIPHSLTAPAVAFAATAPPANVNLITKTVPIRDQAGRGTCVAHAALAAYEIYMAGRGSYQDMSEQFLFWNCKGNDGIPNTDGTWLAKAYPLLQQDGCCLETTWSYNGTLNTANIGQSPPAAGAQMQALSYRISAFNRLAPTSVLDIKSELVNGHCVSFSIPVYDTFLRNANVLYTGDLIMPIPGEIRRGGHAMCIVGYIDLPEHPEFGGGRFIIRNSWGTAHFGVACTYGAGYGTIPYAYIANLSSEAYSMA